MRLPIQLPKGAEDSWATTTNIKALQLYEAYWGIPISENVLDGGSGFYLAIDLDHSISFSETAPGRILLRDEYTLALKYLERRAALPPLHLRAGGDGGAVITGQPGIGKSDISSSCSSAINATFLHDVQVKQPFSITFCGGALARDCLPCSRWT